MESKLRSQDGVTSLASVVGLALMAAVLMTGAMYYTLKRHDQDLVSQLIQQSQQAGQQQAIVTARSLAALGGGLIQTDLFRIQDQFTSGLGLEGLSDAVLIDQDNMIVAAKNQKIIGKQMQDSAWLSVRAQNREVVGRELDQAGQPLLTVVEPMKEQNDTVAWVKLTFAMSPASVSVRAPKDRLWETVRVVGPLAILFYLGCALVVRSTKTAVRREVRGMMPVQQGAEGISSPHRLRKAS